MQISHPTQARETNRNKNHEYTVCVNRNSGHVAKNKNSVRKVQINAHEREMKETFMSCPSLVPMNSTIQDPVLVADTADIELYLNTTESG